MDRIIKLVETLTRPGTAEVVKYLKKGSFATREGGSTHHKYAGGLVAHSLEVYEYMKEKSEGLGFSDESIIICSLFHDLGKVKGHHNHHEHSVEILDRCGFELTDDERYAILNHHNVWGDMDMSSLYRVLQRSDMKSTGEWRDAHEGKKDSPWADLLKAFREM